MPEQVVVDNNGGFRIIEVGPRGPAGPAGVGSVEGAGYLEDGILHIPTDDSPDTGSARSLGRGAQQAAPGDVLGNPAYGGAATMIPKLDDWFAKFAAAKNAPVEIVWITDSIGTIGTNADPAHPWLTSRILNDVAGGDTYRLPVFAQSAGGDIPLATSSTGTGVEIGLGGHSSALDDGEIVTHTETCRGWKMTYVDTGTGTLTIRDGAGGTIIGTVTFTDTGDLKLWESAELTAGSHTLHITSSGSTNVGQIIPINNSAIISYMATHSGYNSAHFSSDPAKALDLIEYLNNSETNNLGLVVIATGANDAPYSTMMPGLISAVQNVYDGDIALWVPYPSNAVSPEEYDAMHPVAISLGLPLIDSSIFFNKFASSYTFDGTHPITSGKRLLAQFNALVLSGNPLGYLSYVTSLKPSIGELDSEAAPGDIMHRIKTKSYVIEDDFILGDHATSGSIGERRWIRTNGASSSGTLQLNGHPGIVRVQTNASAQTASIHLPMSGAIISNANSDWRFAFWFRHASPTSDNRYALGIMTPGAWTHGFAIEKPLGASTWDVVAKFLGSELGRTNTAFASATNVWYKLEFIKFGANVLVMIDDVIINVMTGAGTFDTFNSAHPCFHVYANTGTVQTLDVDRFQMSLYNITRQANGA